MTALPQLPQPSQPSHPVDAPVDGSAAGTPVARHAADVDARRDRPASLGTTRRYPYPDPEGGYGWREAGLLFAWMVALTAFMLGVGFLITRPSWTEGLRSWDAAMSQDWASWRTPLFDTLTRYGSALSDTQVAIAATVLAVVGLRLMRGSWTMPIVVVTAIAGELFYFLALTAVVGRARPEVPHLDAAPPTSSYPSGHTGAAVAFYGCLAILVVRYATHRAFVVPVVILLAAMPVIVALSRVYRGMHYVTDVLAGAMGGLLWLVVVVAVLLPRDRTSST